MSTPFTPSDAERAILSCVTPLPAEALALGSCHGRVLRQLVLAERHNPPFDRVCMDGIAIASTAFASGARRFRIQATQAAGAVPLSLAAPDSAIEVMTGAVLPHGTDTVVPVEEYVVTDGSLAMGAEARAAQWRNVQRRGAEGAPGTAMLTPGMRLGAAEIAVLASAGLAQVSVSSQPRIMVISTGDELIDPGQPIADHQVRRSNAYGVAAALRLHGYDKVDNTHLLDDAMAMRARLAEILDNHEVLAISGGVSKGKFDFVPTVLQALGVKEVFHGVAQRPGHPLWFGVGPQSQLVFGLPGNPVATLMCVARYLLPALQAAAHLRKLPRERIAVADAGAGRSVTSFMPVVFPYAPAPGMAGARPTRGSGDFLALAATDGFVELPPQSQEYERGFVADFYRW